MINLPHPLAFHNPANLVGETITVKWFAQKAIEAGTGARALRMILEKMMRDLMFETPSDDSIMEIAIEKEAVLGLTTPLVKRATEKLAG